MNSRLLAICIIYFYMFNTAFAFQLSPFDITKCMNFEENDVNITDRCLITTPNNNLLFTVAFPEVTAIKLSSSFFDGTKIETTNDGGFKKNPCGILFKTPAIETNMGDVQLDAYETNSQPAQLACALMVCGHDDYKDESSCEWFKTMFVSPRKRDDLLYALQKLKEYLAASDIVSAVDSVNKFAESIPGYLHSTYLGMRFKNSSDMLMQKLASNDAVFVRRNLIGENRERNDVSNPKLYVTQRHAKFCSRAEQDVFVSEDANVKLCRAISNYPLPYDLHYGPLSRFNSIGSSYSETADAFINNLINPIPVQLMKPQEMMLNFISIKKNSTGVRPVLTSIANDHLKYKINESMIMSTLQEGLRLSVEKRKSMTMPAAMLENAEKSGLKIPLSSVTASLYETLDTEVNGRLFDPSWSAAVMKSHKLALLREIAFIMADDMVESFDMLMNIERVEMSMSMESTISVTKEPVSMDPQKELNKASSLSTRGE